MNRVLICTLILSFATSAAWAQPAGKGPGPGMRGQGARMQHIQQNLGLSQEQVDQIRTIRQNGGGRDEIRAVLTEEQRAKMDQHHAARQGRGGPGNRGDRPRPNDGYGNGSGQAPAPPDPSETGDG